MLGAWQEWAMVILLCLGSSWGLAQDSMSVQLQKLHAGHRESLQNYGHSIDHKKFRIEVLSGAFYSVCYSRQAASFYTQEASRACFFHIRPSFTADRHYNQELKFIVFQCLKLGRNTYLFKWSLSYRRGPDGFGYSLVLDPDGSDFGTVSWKECWASIQLHVPWWRAGAWFSQCRTGYKCYLRKIVELAMEFNAVYANRCMRK